MQGDPLRWFVICTPRLVSTRHKWRFPSSEAQVRFRPFDAVIPLCAHALDDPEDKLRIPSSNISHVRFFIPISPQRLENSTTLLTVELVQAIISPSAAMWHESMEILAEEGIRGMNKGLLIGQTLLLPLPSGLRSGP
jgi:hypothetical protein